MLIRIARRHRELGSASVTGDSGIIDCNADSHRPDRRAQCLAGPTANVRFCIVDAPGEKVERAMHEMKEGTLRSGGSG
ncbi:MAG: hypothetical protein ABI629_13150 [bacterium]